MTRPVRIAATNIRRALEEITPEQDPVVGAGWWVRGALEDESRWVEAADLETVLNGYAS